jgi:hypothetical protein
LKNEKSSTLDEQMRITAKLYLLRESNSRAYTSLNMLKDIFILTGYENIKILDEIPSRIQEFIVDGELMEQFQNLMNEHLITPLIKSFED